MELYFLVVSLAAACAIFWLAKSASQKEYSAPRLALDSGLLAVFCRFGLGWIGAQSVLALGELAPDLRPAQALGPAVFLTLFGAAVFLNLSPRPQRRNFFARGLLLGAEFSALGFAAYAWMSVAAAWRLLGWFCGSFAWVALPAALGASFALTAAILLRQEARRIRWPALALLFLAWWLPARFFMWRLKTSWGYGPRDLAQAAGILDESRAQKVNIAWLRPIANKPYRFDYERPMIEDGASADVQSLWKLYDYLRRCRYQSLFARKALHALRKGWQDWWDPDMALKADLLAYPGRAAPDYMGALALIRAGRLDAERYENLRELDDLAAPRDDEGFRDVTPSQHIFEAFEKAYARFDDQLNAGFWIDKVENLWPVYEDKVEADAVQDFESGRVKGSVFIDGKPAKPVLVGLFCLAVSTSEPMNAAGVISQSAFPNGRGHFQFKNLGAGFYYLGLMGSPSYLRGRIEGSPGIFSISESSPTVKLDPILIERSETLSPGGALSPSYLRFLSGLLKEEPPAKSRPRALQRKSAGS